MFANRRGASTGTRVLLAALGVDNAMGGMERFNKEVSRELSALPKTLTRAISLWDEPNNHVYGCRRSKVRFAKELVKGLIFFRPDTVLLAHTLLLPLTLPARLLRPKSKIALIVHGVEAWSQPDRWQRLFLRFLDEVYAVSDVTRKRFVEAWDWHGKTDIIPNRLPTALVTGPCARHLGSDPGVQSASLGRGSGRSLLTVARLESQSPGKNVDTIIQALARCSHVDLYLTVVGDGDDRSRLEQLASDLGLADRVEFKGIVSDEELCAIYLSSDIFVLPSTREGFGIVFLEAWAHGLPTVGSDAAGSAEVLGRGKYGVCVAPSPDRLAHELTQLAEDKVLRDEYRARGVERLGDYGEEAFRRALRRMAV